MVTAWIISFINDIVAVFPTSGVIDGVCYAYIIWKNQTAHVFYFIWNFVAYYVIIIFIFVFCYSRILVVIRRQARVMAGHAGAGSSAAQNQYNQIQSNVIKTMIFVSACYAISWLPAYIRFMIQTHTRYRLAPVIMGLYFWHIHTWAPIHSSTPPSWIQSEKSCCV